MRCHNRCNAIWSKVWQMCWPRVLWSRLIMSMTYTSQTDEKSNGSISCAKKCKSSDLHVLRITPSSWNRHSGAPPMGKLSTESRSRSGRNFMIDTTLRNTISAFILAVFNPVFVFKCTGFFMSLKVSILLCLMASEKLPLPGNCATVTLGVRGLRELPWPQSRRAGWPSFDLLTDHIPPSLSPIAITRVSSLASFNILILFVQASHVIHLGQQLTSGTVFPSFPYPTPPRSPLFYFLGFQAQFWNSKFWSIFIPFPVAVSKA